MSLIRWKIEIVKPLPYNLQYIRLGDYIKLGLLKTHYRRMFRGNQLTHNIASGSRVEPTHVPDYNVTTTHDAPHW
jgi:hypothetical protein